MKVKDLIKLLQEQDQDKEVTYDSGNFSVMDITEVIYDKENYGDIVVIF